MGLYDVIQAEDRVEIKFSTLYSLLRGCAERDLMKNAIMANVPHRYIREMLSGVPEKKIKDKEEAHESREKINEHS